MYKVVKYGKGNISAKIVADSINLEGNRVTTFELEYHRYIHSELMTHRLFSRNAMSSRAVPVDKMIEQVRKKPATPIHWGKNKAGMQAEEECDHLVDLGAPAKFTAEEVWTYSAARSAANLAEALAEAGYHKQIVNRLLEPFQMMKVVVTSTEFSNFFWLRCDKDAQPEIQELATCMKSAYEESEPDVLKAGEWHTPYVTHQRSLDGVLHYIAPSNSSDEKGNTSGKYLSKAEAIAISSSCCAQVSYRNIDNSFEKAMKVYERLGVGGSKIHASPFEHVASPMKLPFNEHWITDGSNGWVEGVTHVDKAGNYWSGNFKGWIQHRQLLENHTCWDYKG